MAGVVLRVRGERQRVRAHRHVQAFTRSQRRDLAVDRHLAGTADVDDAELAARKERALVERRHFVELDGLRHRHHAADDHAFDVAEREVHVIRHEQTGDVEQLSQLRGVGGLNDARMTGVSGIELHVSLVRGLCGDGDSTGLATARKPVSWSGALATLTNAVESTASIKWHVSAVSKLSGAAAGRSRG